jgi:hypothetical protein
VEATLLDFIVTKLSGDLGLDIFNDLCPNGWGETGRFQHPPEQARRQPGFLVVPLQDAPRRAVTISLIWRPRRHAGWIHGRASRADHIGGDPK